jgi:hypothetical protein
MECPYCGCELRLATNADVAVPSALRTTVPTTCPSPRCARALLVELPGTQERVGLDAGGGAAEPEVRLLKVPPRRGERLPLGKRALVEVVAALVIAIGATAFALVIGLRYVSWPDPGPIGPEAELMGLAALGSVVLVAGLILDGTLRRRSRPLPPRHAELVLLALPKGYRA